jgi:hypothetical protein
MTVVRTLSSTDGRRKVEIYRRDDGTYGFEAWNWSDEPLERCWIPYGNFSHCIAPNADGPEREARGRVPWLSSGGEDAQCEP